ncbi:N-acetylmuramoyl-L-alanine amidase [Salinispora tropica]|uniref:Cell wall hydrolase/autolysin n=1 Tax=Salinispora tropica (strain ATCC BAA-916 / DSM 44818 / JCM 13857 / NBRC 105044 / CNB-440) TaxID=369723 RepID=A4XDJ3_SALTO|nr:N-acetylmuramoyl-L-alanine amidase [Salinispora tropica]ABP57009.1 cell wall hydrolase/autolysin [Salinispora tropica CNB-440]
MRPIRPGDRGPAVTEIRKVLAGLDLLVPAAPDSDEFDAHTERAVRAFQQSRGLSVDGRVGTETWQALDAARWRLGARTLYHSVPEPLIGEDIRSLQERLLEMGYDVGRADAIYGVRTARALAQFQREVGLAPDGTCGPHTVNSLRRLGRKVVGGRPQWLRESDAIRQSGPALVGRTVVIDPGHGGSDPGVAVPEGQLHWTEADLVHDLASRLEGRLAAAGVRVQLTRGPAQRDHLPDVDRAALANSLGADVFISLHLDGHVNPAAEGVATYHYGTDNGVTSTTGERLAGLVQREIVARTGLRDCRSHAKAWDLLRLTRMPAVRVEVGYLTSPADRSRLIDPRFRDRVVEAIVAAIQRMYYPIEQDVPTGSIDVSKLRAMVAAGTVAAGTVVD